MLKRRRVNPQRFVAPQCGTSVCARGHIHALLWRFDIYSLSEETQFRLLPFERFTSVGDAVGVVSKVISSSIRDTINQHRKRI